MADKHLTKHGQQSGGGNQPVPAWAGRWLSVRRLEPYLAACGGDAERALSLYEWNIDLGGVLMRDIAHFEVALRNAYDRVMRERWEGGTGCSTRARRC